MIAQGDGVGRRSRLKYREKFGQGKITGIVKENQGKVREFNSS